MAIPVTPAKSKHKEGVNICEWVELPACLYLCIVSENCSSCVISATQHWDNVFPVLHQHSECIITFLTCVYKLWQKNKMIHLEVYNRGIANFKVWIKLPF